MLSGIPESLKQRREWTPQRLTIRMRSPGNWRKKWGATGSNFLTLIRSKKCTLLAKVGRKQGPNTEITSQAEWTAEATGSLPVGKVPRWPLLWPWGLLWGPHGSTVKQLLPRGTEKSSAGPWSPGQPMHTPWSHIWKELKSLFQNLLL